MKMKLHGGKSGPEFASGCGNLSRVVVGTCRVCFVAMACAQLFSGGIPLLEDVLHLPRKSCCYSLSSETLRLVSVPPIAFVPALSTQWIKESQLELQLLLSYTDSSQQLGDDNFF